jgi:chromosome segregation ATPase
MNLNKLFIESNEKTDYINSISDEIDKIDDEIVNLEAQYKNRYEVLNKLSKDIFDTNISIDHLNIEINLLKDKIKDAILNLYTNTNLEDTNKKLSEKKDNLNINLLKLDHLGQFILQIGKDLNELQLQIRSNQDYKETLSNLILLAPYRENTSEITINDLIIKPE